MKTLIDFGEILVKLGLENGIKAVKAAGFDGIDFSFKDKKGKDFLLSDNWEEYAHAVRTVLDREGLVCNQTHAPVGFSSEDKICPKAEKFGILLRCLRFSQILGAKIVVVHAVTDVKPVDFIPYNLRFYKMLEPYAQKAGVKIGVENLFKFDGKFHRFEGVLETGEKLSSFLQKLRSPQFVACVDTGHAGLTGTPPQKLISAMNKNLVKCLHLHDNDGKDDLHSLPYTGALNWQEIISALKKMGYDGDITLEVMFFMEKFTVEELPAALALAGKMANELRFSLKN